MSYSNSSQLWIHFNRHLVPGYTEMILKTTSLVSEPGRFIATLRVAAAFTSSRRRLAAVSLPTRCRLDVDSTRDATGCHLAWLDFGAEPIKRRARRRPGGGAMSRFGHVPGILDAHDCAASGTNGTRFRRIWPSLVQWVSFMFDSPVEVKAKSLYKLTVIFVFYQIPPISKYLHVDRCWAGISLFHGLFSPGYEY